MFNVLWNQRFSNFSACDPQSNRTKDLIDNRDRTLAAGVSSPWKGSESSHVFPEGSSVQSMESLVLHTPPCSVLSPKPPTQGQPLRRMFFWKICEWTEMKKSRPGWSSSWCSAVKPLRTSLSKTETSCQGLSNSLFWLFFQNHNIGPKNQKGFYLLQILCVYFYSGLNNPSMHHSVCYNSYWTH